MATKSTCVASASPTSRTTATATIAISIGNNKPVGYVGSYINNGGCYIGSGGNELGSGPHAVGPLGTNRPDCHVAGELLNGIVETRINLGRQVLESMRKIHDQSVGPSPRLIVGL